MVDKGSDVCSDMRKPANSYLRCESPILMPGDIGDLIIIEETSLMIDSPHTGLCASD